MLNVLLASCQLPVASCQLPVASCQGHLISHLFQGATKIISLSHFGGMPGDKIVHVLLRGILTWRHATWYKIGICGSSKQKGVLPKDLESLLVLSVVFFKHMLANCHSIRKRSPSLLPKNKFQQRSHKGMMRKLYGMSNGISHLIYILQQSQINNMMIDLFLSF